MKEISDIQIYQLIKRWFKEYNYLFTLSVDYNQSFLNFVQKIVDSYLTENNLKGINENLIWGHIRYILGNTYKEEIETYKMTHNVERPGQRNN